MNIQIQIFQAALIKSTKVFRARSVMKGLSIATTYQILAVVFEPNGIYWKLILITQIHSAGCWFSDISFVAHEVEESKFTLGQLGGSQQGASNLPLREAIRE